eukprot:scpid80377/ scgid16475/ 
MLSLAVLALLVAPKLDFLLSLHSLQLLLSSHLCVCMFQICFAFLLLFVPVRTQYLVLLLCRLVIVSAQRVIILAASALCLASLFRFPPLSISGSILFTQTAGKPGDSGYTAYQLPCRFTVLILSRVCSIGTRGLVNAGKPFLMAV